MARPGASPKDAPASGGRTAWNPAALHASLEAHGCAALVVVASSSRDCAIAPFVGSARLGESLLILARGRKPRLACFSPMERDEARRTGLGLLTPEDLDLPELHRQALEPETLLAQILANALDRLQIAPARIALAGHGGAGTVHSACKRLERVGWNVVAGEDLLRCARKKKTSFQLAEIREASRGALEAFRRLAGLLAAATLRRGELWLEGERLRVGRLRREIAQCFAARGLDQPEGNIIACGAEAGVPHTRGDSHRVLAAGEAIVVDLFPQGQLFADCTRTFCVGRPPVELARAQDLVRRALEAAGRAARPGLRGFDLQETVCRDFAAAGYPTPISRPGTEVGYVHGLGHGVGYELHEYPSFRKDAGAEGVLRAGDVLTIEPGLYDPAAGYGVRLEDLGILTPRGLENLTPLPYDLDPRTWPAS